MVTLSPEAEPKLSCARMPSPTGPQRLIRLLRRGLRKPPRVIARRVGLRGAGPGRALRRPLARAPLRRSSAAAGVRERTTSTRCGRASRRGPTRRTPPAIDPRRAAAPLPGRRGAHPGGRGGRPRPPRAAARARDGGSRAAHRLAAGLPVGRRLAARLHARHRLREPARCERREGALGADPAAVADARGPGLSAERRRALRRGRARGARGLDRREPLRRDRQLVLHDGGGAADPELDVVLPRLPRAAAPGRTPPSASGSCAPSTCTATSPTAPRALGRQRQPLHGGRGRASPSRASSSARDEDPRALAGARAGRSCARSSRARCTRTASTSRPPSPYHRLVAELFLLPALYREALGLDVPAAYRERVMAMARFAAAYSRPDGSARRSGATRTTPARCPLGGQDLNDHRYLAGLVGAAWNVAELKEAFAGEPSEVFWLLGPAAADSLPATAAPATPAPLSQSFPDGGFFVMRNAARPRVRRLRPGRPRRPRRPRPQRLPLLRGRPRRRAPRLRLRRVRLHALVRGAQPLPLDGVPQHAAGRRRGDEPVQARPAVGPRVRRPARRAPLRDRRRGRRLLRGARGLRAPPGARHAGPDDRARPPDAMRSRSRTPSRARAATGSRSRCTSPRA